MNGGDEITVSYVMTAYRSEPEWLRGAVGAVLGEPDPLELILVDDGSPRPIAEVLLFLVADPRLRVIRSENQGVAEARNLGVSLARGRYVRFVDDDDEIAPGSTKNLLGHTLGSEGVIGYGATLFCDSELRPRWKMSCGIQGRGAEAALVGRFTTRISAFLIPLRLLQRVGPIHQMPVAEDWDLLVRLMEVAPVRGDRQVAYRYRRHPWGLTSDASAGNEGAAQVVARYLERNPGAARLLRRRALATVEAQAARTSFARGRRWEGTRYLIRSLRLDPRAALLQLRLALWALGGRLRRLGAG